MYRRFYWYKSGITQTMRSGLKNIYLESLKMIKLKKDDVVWGDDDDDGDDGGVLNTILDKKEKNTNSRSSAPGGCYW